MLHFNHRLPLRRVVIHGGRNEFYDEDKRKYHVPRNSLILDLQVALEEPGRTLLIDESVTNREQLIEEASNLKPDITAAGRERIGFFKEDVHDDRVFAFAIAYWLARKVLLPPRLEHDHTKATRHLPFKAPAKLPFSAKDFTGW